MRAKGLAPLRRKIRTARFTQKNKFFANAAAFRLAITPGAGKYAEQRIFADPPRSSPFIYKKWFG